MKGKVEIVTTRSYVLTLTEEEVDAFLAASRTALFRQTFPADGDANSVLFEAYVELLKLTAHSTNKQAP